MDDAQSGIVIGESTLKLARPFVSGMQLLVRALELSNDVQGCPWTFAIEIDRLVAVGITTCDLRWLVCKGYVENACETTRIGESQRTFGVRGGLIFSSQTCFVLTEEGSAFARWLTVNAAADGQGSGAAPSSAKPIWDATLRELWLNGGLVKRFRVPAPNQELILTAFAAEGWPRSLDDPLPPCEELPRKHRYHAVIQSLNRSQKAQRIHFSGDGKAKAIHWELVRAGSIIPRVSPQVPMAMGLVKTRKQRSSRGLQLTSPLLIICTHSVMRWRANP